MISFMQATRHQVKLKLFTTLILALMAALVVVGCEKGNTPPANPPKPIKPVKNGKPAAPKLASARYVGRASCITCHEEAGRDFAGSDHDLAMEPATPKTVLGDFNNAEFKHLGTTSRMTRKDDKFFITTEGADGKEQTFPIKYTFGYFPLQQYLVELPKGKIQCLTIAWDAIDRKWYHLYPDEKIPHDDWLHWTKGGQNWNYMCAECHSTDLKKNYDLETRTYKTTYSEIDVSCEACHGPGSRHVKWATDRGLDGSAFHDETGDFGLTLKMKVQDSKPQVEMCARCHARRRVVHPDYHPGKKFDDHYSVELLLDRLYHPDGQILDEVYVYGSFLQSKMYHKGVRCSNCHNPHTTKLRLQGNNLCMQCHDPKKFNTPKHHHHKAQVNGIESKGASCIECHMPTKTYMGVDVRRDHSFRIPRPDLTAKIGVPNTCTSCHKDKPAKWAADQIVQWYGPKRPEPEPFALVFDAARKHKPGTEPELAKLVWDTKRPAIVRATALMLLGESPSPSVIDISGQMLRDAEALVRISALRNLENLPAEQLGPRLEPLLKDPVRSVRVEAVRSLSRLAPARYSNKTTDVAKLFWKVLDEYKAGQDGLSDQPGAHLNLAVIHENLQEPKKAIKSYETAIDIEPSFVPARMNLAMIRARQGDNPEAERLLREAIKLAPTMASANYSLGLLLAENPNRLKEAAKYLGIAAEHDPGNPRMQYNYGLSMQRLGQAAEAERGLLAAYRLDPRNADFVNALVVFFSQQKRWRHALHFAQLLAQMYPNEPRLKAQIEFLKRNAITEP
jgi:predicted CXXCH cytochrome family protein